MVCGKHLFQANTNIMTPNTEQAKSMSLLEAQNIRQRIQYSTYKCIQVFLLLPIHVLLLFTRDTNLMSESNSVF